MKKRISVFFVMVCLAVAGCRHYRGGNLSIMFNDSGRYYSMKARFDEGRTGEVDRYMDKMIGDESNMSFTNTRIDGQIGLNDHTSFYIKKYRGYVYIKFDKDQNSEDSYRKVQDMCQGIKRLLAGEEKGR